MPESAKAELVFQYRRTEDGAYNGRAEVVEPGSGQSLRPPLEVALHREDWVKFVVDQMRAHKEASVVKFKLITVGGVVREHHLAEQTVDKIRSGDLNAEDITL